MTDWYWNAPVRLVGVDVLDETGVSVPGRVFMTLDIAPPILVAKFGNRTVSAKEFAFEPWEAS